MARYLNLRHKFLQLNELKGRLETVLRRREATLLSLQLLIDSMNRVNQEGTLFMSVLTIQLEFIFECLESSEEDLKILVRSSDWLLRDPSC